MMCYYIRLLRLIEERITIGYYGGCVELIMRHWKIFVLTWDGWKRGYSILDVRTNCDKFKDFFERFSTEEEGE
jgi:hypothetical protein